MSKYGCKAMPFLHDDERMYGAHEDEAMCDGGKVRGMAEGGLWISGAIKHPGSLHRALGVPQGEKIPAKKLNKAAHSDNPTLARRANLAKTLKGFH